MLEIWKNRDICLWIPKECMKKNGWKVTILNSRILENLFFEGKFQRRY
jgi:hypothetical protein